MLNIREVKEAITIQIVRKSSSIAMEAVEYKPFKMIGIDSHSVRLYTSIGYRYH